MSTCPYSSLEDALKAASKLYNLLSYDQQFELSMEVYSLCISVYNIYVSYGITPQKITCSYSSLEDFFQDALNELDELNQTDPSQVEIIDQKFIEACEEKMNRWNS
ncbi:MAG: hypothetical protein FJZ56_07280 [Chlamydiae bacterium]|nr:hypothetical protein [Chlamydiota bacterium]